jgi:MraZ protein
MFMGEFQHSIDAKGRLIIPSRFRDGLGERFIATKGLDHSLFLYPLKEWEIIEQKLKNLPFTRADVRAFVRLFFSGASECELDRQGRILLTANLREFARINRDVVVIGVSSRVEIWAKEEWDGYNERAEEAYENIAESIVGLDLGL